MQTGSLTASHIQKTSDCLVWKGCVFLFNLDNYHSFLLKLSAIPKKFSHIFCEGNPQKHFVRNAFKKRKLKVYIVSGALSAVQRG